MELSKEYLIKKVQNKIVDEFCIQIYGLRELRVLNYLLNDGTYKEKFQDKMSEVINTYGRYKKKNLISSEIDFKNGVKERLKTTGYDDEIIDLYELIYKSHKADKSLLNYKVKEEIENIKNGILAGKTAYQNGKKGSLNPYHLFNRIYNPIIGFRDLNNVINLLGINTSEAINNGNTVTEDTYKELLTKIDEKLGIDWSVTNNNMKISSQKDEDYVDSSCNRIIKSMLNLRTTFVLGRLFNYSAQKLSGTINSNLQDKTKYMNHYLIGMRNRKMSNEAINLFEETALKNGFTENYLSSFDQFEKAYLSSKTVLERNQVMQAYYREESIRMRKALDKCDEELNERQNDNSNESKLDRYCKALLIDKNKLMIEERDLNVILRKREDEIANKLREIYKPMPIIKVDEIKESQKCFEREYVEPENINNLTVNQEKEDVLEENILTSVINEEVVKDL